MSSSFSVGVSRQNLFAAGDSLRFTLHQPLRVESAPMRILSGIGRDLTTGDVILGTTETSLSPSGRQLSFESGYAMNWGRWTAEAGAAYSLDAAHVRGAREVSAMLWLTRAF